DVLATDLSTRALEAARSAEWPLARAEQLPASYRKEFMLRGEDRMRAGPRLCQVVRFAQLNLNELDRMTPGSYELIFCRNVLIYFDTESKGRVLSTLAPQLAPGGLLLLGHAEALGTNERLRSVVPTIYAAAGA